MGNFLLAGILSFDLVTALLDLTSRWWLRSVDWYQLFDFRGGFYIRNSTFSLPFDWLMPIVHKVRVFMSWALLAWVFLCKFVATSLHLELFFIQFNFFFFYFLHFEIFAHHGILLILDNSFITWLLLIVLTIFINNFLSYFRLLYSCWSLLTCLLSVLLRCVLFHTLLKLHHTQHTLLLHFNSLFLWLLISNNNFRFNFNISLCLIILMSWLAVIILLLRSGFLLFIPLEVFFELTGVECQPPTLILDWRPPLTTKDWLSSQTRIFTHF